MPVYNSEGMISCPPTISERWFRAKMARTEKTNVNGQDFTLQSVSPKWYYEQNSRYGMSGEKRDLYGYMDTMFKNVVVSPPEVAAKGMLAFEAKEDIETPEKLIQEIERFLRPGTAASKGTAAGKGE